MDSMISGYGQNGNGKEAIELFNQMENEKIQPDSITFVSLLNACSHSGLVDDAFYYFNIMKEKYIQYTCLVDTLGRAGRLKEMVT